MFCICSLSLVIVKAGFCLTHVSMEVSWTLRTILRTGLDSSKYSAGVHPVRGVGVAVCQLPGRGDFCDLLLHMSPGSSPVRLLPERGLGTHPWEPGFHSANNWCSRIHCTESTPPQYYKLQYEVYDDWGNDKRVYKWNITYMGVYQETLYFSFYGRLYSSLVFTEAK